MTELFKNQLMHELGQAGFHQATMSDDGQSVTPVPEYPKLRIKAEHVQYGIEASQAERDLAHWQMTDIQQRAIDACRAWENSQKMPDKVDGVENFRLLSEYNGVVLAARNDGVRGLYFTTWEYGHDHSSLNHGHYTTSYADALQHPHSFESRVWNWKNRDMSSV